MDSPATKRMRLSASRSSLSGRKSLSGPGASALPHASGSVMQSSNRLASATQPSYDFLGGETNENEQPQSQQRSTSRPPSRSGSSIPPPFKRSALRTSMIPRPEASSGANIDSAQHQEELLALRSRLNSVKYELENFQSERNLLVLQHEKELREAQARADADYAKYQNAESERLKISRLAEKVGKEVSEIKDRALNEKTALERKLRDIQAKCDNAVEEKEDVDGRFTELQREYDRFRADEVEGKRSRLEATLEEVRQEMETYKSRFEITQRRLEERDSDVERLEAQAVDLRGQAGGGEELDVLKRELAEQMNYVRRLEGQAREQNAELRKLRDERRSVNVVQEEKRALETQVQVLKDAERRAGELEIQKEILEDEKRMWTSLLEKEGHDGSEREFESPEAVVKALVHERIERAAVVERLGRIESEQAGKDEDIRELETERDKLKEELDKSTKAAPSTSAPPQSDNKAYKRLERLHQLAVKEVEYLRAQLKSLDDETIMLENESIDNQHAEQVKKLENLVDEYRGEIKTLHDNISKVENDPAPATPQIEPRGTKRPATEEGGDEDTKSQVGPLLRKNKNLQTALQKVSSTSQLLATELQATKSQLKALRNSSKTRILELRDNPTAQAETIKMDTLRTLKTENQSLMKALRGQDLQTEGISTVPRSSLDALNLDLKEMERSVADKEKRMRRQREIWTDKAAEFRDVISSVLGYRVNFLPNGKVKVSSIFYPSQVEDDEEEIDLEDPTNYIMFDGEKGTMKISGGNDGQFGLDVKELVDFWVKERKEIPCFLAAMTLEFYEKFGAGGAGGMVEDGAEGEAAGGDEP